MNELIDVINERGLDALRVTETKRKGSKAADILIARMALWSEVFQSEPALGILLHSRLVYSVKVYD